MERLTVEDQVMLWGDDMWPQEIGALAILDGAALLDLHGRLQIGQIRRVVEARLHLVPRFRQLLHMPRRGLGRPLWMDADGFDVADHIQHAPLPTPCDEATLLEQVERLRRHRLDPSRPLWQMWFLTGLPERRVGLFVRMHHVVADGMAGMAAVATFLDPTPNAPAETAPPWIPTSPPTARSLLADNIRWRAGRLGRVFSTPVHLATAARRARAVWPTIRGVLTAHPTPGTSLNRMVGPDRVVALIRSDLDQVKRIARAHHATVNDVLLAIVTAGLRQLLASRGELTDGQTVRISVPISLRRQRIRTETRGNLISQMVIPLPVGVPDPTQRLARIAADTATHKARHQPSAGTLLGTRLARRTMLRYLRRQPINLTSAYLPGPRHPVFLAGARLREVFPVLPLIATVTFGVGALSYAGQLSITVVADKDTYPDLEILTTGARTELHTLATLDVPTRVAVSEGC